VVQETCNLARKDVLMKPDRTPKIRQVWPTLRFNNQNRPPKKSGYE